VAEDIGNALPTVSGTRITQTTCKAYAMTSDEGMDDQVTSYRPALSEAAERAHGKVKKYEIRKKAPRGLRPAR
jgi:hypothetical protein